MYITPSHAIRSKRYGSFETPQEKPLGLQRHEIGKIGTGNYLAPLLNPPLLPAGRAALLVLGDVHGNWEPVQHALAELEAQKSLTSKTHVVVLGDMFYPPKEKFSRPVWYVQGNLDRYNLFYGKRAELASKYNLHRLELKSSVLGIKTVALHGVSINQPPFPLSETWLNSSVDYSSYGQTPLVDINSLNSMIKTGETCDLFLSHAPPFVKSSFASKLVGGEEYVYSAIAALRPRLALCAHLHRDWVWPISLENRSCLAMGVNYCVLSMAFVDIESLRATKLFTYVIPGRGDSAPLINLPSLKFRDVPIEDIPDAAEQEALIKLVEISLKYLALAEQLPFDKTDSSSKRLAHQINVAKDIVSKLAPAGITDLQGRLKQLLTSDWFAARYQQAHKTLGAHSQEAQQKAFKYICGTSTDEYSQIFANWLTI